MFRTILICVLAHMFFGDNGYADISGPFSPLSYKDGISFQDPEGYMQAQVRFRMQNRLEYQTTSGTDFDASRLTGNVRRLRLRSSGYVGKPQYRYLIQLSFSRNDVDWENTGFPNIIRDAAVIWQPLEWGQFVFGLTKLPGNRQRVISSGELQFPDRSLVNATFNIDRDFGFQAKFDREFGAVPTNLRLAVTTGDGRNTEINGFGLSYTARVEVLPLGEFKDDGDYREGDLEFNETPKISIGGGANYNKNAQRTGGQVGRSMSQPKSFSTYFADMIFKYRGLSVYTEAMLRKADTPISVETSGTRFVYNGYGLLAQAGYCFRSFWEPAVRFATIVPRGEVRTLTDRVNQATVNISRYIRGHRVKVQTDVTREWARNLVTQRTAGYWMARFQVELGI